MITIGKSIELPSFLRGILSYKTKLIPSKYNKIRYKIILFGIFMN